MDFTKLDGLVPAVVQDDETNEVLRVGFMNEAALARTVETGSVTFFSRTRQALAAAKARGVDHVAKSAKRRRHRCWSGR